MQESMFLPTYCYTFQHVDELAFVLSPETAQSSMYGYEGVVDLVPQVAEAFRRKGWEGDGKIGLIWIPPFIMDEGGTGGVFVWFVKQGNNGEAFIGSSVPLPFEPLVDQNR